MLISEAANSSRAVRASGTAGSRSADFFGV